MELTEARRGLQVESDEHDLLRAALGVVLDDLEVAWLEESSSLMARAVDIMAQVRQHKREALRSGITQAFTIARSHYADSIDLETMSLGLAPSYEASERDEIETVVASLTRDLVDRVKEIVLPRRGWLVN